MGLALVTETGADVTCVTSGHKLSALAIGNHVPCSELLTHKDPKPLCSQPFLTASDTGSGHPSRSRHSSVAPWPLWSAVVSTDT